MADNTQVNAGPAHHIYGRGGDICLPTASGHAQAWTCTIMCDPGTRYPIERLFNAPGAELCAVAHCECRPLPPAAPWLNAPPRESIQDLALPLAFVIFGVDHFLRGPR